MEKSADRKKKFYKALNGIYSGIQKYFEIIKCEIKSGIKTYEDCKTNLSYSIRSKNEL